jgi:hypothetical protein
MLIEFVMPPAVGLFVHSARWQMFNRAACVQCQVSFYS